MSHTLLEFVAIAGAVIAAFPIEEMSLETA